MGDDTLVDQKIRNFANSSFLWNYNLKSVSFTSKHCFDIGWFWFHRYLEEMSIEPISDASMGAPHLSIPIKHTVTTVPSSKTGQTTVAGNGHLGCRIAFLE